MRILQLLTDTNIGGAGVCVENYLSATVNSENAVVALPKGAAMTGRLERTGAEVIGLDIAGDTSFSKGDIGDFTRLIRKIKPDIVHTHGCLTGRIAARIAGGCKTVYTKHTLGMTQSGIAAAVNRSVTDMAVAVSQKAADELIQSKMPQSKVRIIYNGCKEVPDMSQSEAKKAFGLDNSDIAVVCVARLETVKNHVALIAACDGARKTFPNLKLLLVGGGTLYGKLGSSAIFTGELDDITAAYRAADIFALVSHSENMPLTLLEAMSAKLPCVVTPAGGMPEAANSDTALFTSTSADEIEKAILQLCSDANLRQRLGLVGYSRFNEKFTVEGNALNLDRLYRELVHGEY